MMNPLRWRALCVFVAMCVTAVATVLIKPSIRMADQGDKVQLEQMIPRQFGGWVMDERQSAAIINPQGNDLVNRLYQQVLSRTYLNPQRGQAIMLSIAYGENQSHSNDLHVPDVCYAAGGFQINRSMRGELSTLQGDIPVKRLVTQLNQRREPLTYWAVVGEHVTVGAVAPKLTSVAYGLRGIVPDGLIFRVSSLGADADAEFAAQQAFVQDLMNALPSQHRKRLAALP